MPRNKMLPSFEQNKENILTYCPFGQAYPIVVYRKLLQTLKKIENDELDEMYKRNWARYSKEGKLLFPCLFLSLTVTDYFKQPEV